MKIDSLGNQTDLGVLKLMGSDIEKRNGHLVIRTSGNPTFYWGNYLLLDHVPSAEQVPDWLERFAAELPYALHIGFGFEAPGATAADLQGFADHGLTIDALTVLAATAVQPPAHANRDAVYRALTSDDDWEQSIGLQMECNESNENIERRRAFVTRRAAGNRTLVAAGHATWFGAFIGRELVAQMGLVRVGPSVARFQAVETHPSHRRTGLAGSLLHHVGAYGLGTLRVEQLVIVAETEYVAIRIYRAVGFVDAETQFQALRPPQGDP